MSLPEAAGEFARQVVIALAGDTGREERVAWSRVERELLAERDALEADLRAAWMSRDKLREEVRLVLRERDKYSVARITALAERDELLAAARKVLNGDLGRYEEVAELAEAVMRVEAKKL